MNWKKVLAGSLLAASLIFPYAPATGMAAAAEQEQEQQAQAALEQDIQALASAYQELLKHYSKPDQDKLLQAAIQGMLEILEDPYTNYMSREDYDSFTDAMNQSYAGIGISGHPAEDGRGVVVTEVFAGSPAEESGLQVHDLVLKVDDQASPAGAPEELMERIRGEEGTSVRLTLERDGRSLDITVLRKHIHLPLVEWQDLGDGISYIPIYSFGEETTEEFKAALEKAVSHQAQGLVIDLRGNGGGTVIAALEIADLLLEEGTMVIVHDEEGEDLPIIAEAGATPLPAVVLVDGNSASASEILAGALQKNGRAPLVGTTTFGKGTMQSPVELTNGAVLKVSVDRWELPDGSTNDGRGIKPDMELTRPEAVINAAKQLLLPGRAQALKLARKGGGGLLNGEYELIGAPAPVQAENSLYLPLRYTVESFGSPVVWSDGKVTFELNGKKVESELGASTLTVGGQPVEAADAVQVLDGSAYLSAEAWAELTGRDVETDEEFVIIHTK